MIQQTFTTVGPSAVVTYLSGILVRLPTYISYEISPDSLFCKTKKNTLLTSRISRMKSYHKEHKGYTKFTNAFLVLLVINSVFLVVINLLSRF